MAARLNRRTVRIGLLAVTGLLVLTVGAVAIFLATFDANDQKPRIIAAVKQATGRDLALNGPIGLKLSLQPTIEARDVAFANPPGFSRPQMATLERLGLQIRLLPLLRGRVEVGRLVLDHPNILLETDAQGRPNWQFARASRAASPAQTDASPAQPSTPATLTVQDVRIQDGIVGYRDAKSGQSSTLDITKLTLNAASAESPLHLTMDAAFNGTRFDLTADTGSLSRLQDTTATTPWPVKLGLTAGSARLSVDGTLTQPMRGQGYDLAATSTIPDLAAFASLVPGVKLPSLHDVTFSTKLVDRGAQIPGISSLVLHAGQADLGELVAGLLLDRLDIDAPAPDRPVKAAAAARIGGSPVSLEASLGTLAMLTAPGKPPSAVPVEMALHAAGGTATLTGKVADPAELSGIELALEGQIPNLADLSGLARTPLPAVKSITLHAGIADAPGGLAKGLALHQLRLESSEGNLSGDATLSLGTPRAFAANLKSTRINADVLLAAMRSSPSTGSNGAASAATPQSAPPPPAAAPQRSDRLFSDRPLRLDLLKQANADLTLTIAILQIGGGEYRSVAAHLVVRDGRLRLEPFSADLPDGRRMELAASANASAQPAQVSLTAKMPGIPLRPLLAALGEPAYANGNLEIYADLRGAGDSPHAVAGSLDGSVGVALINGSIDNRLLGATLGKVLEQINALDLVRRGGSSDVRCLAARIDFQHGVGAVRSLALSSSLLTMTGGGSVDLGQETLGLLVRPEARIGGKGVVLPVRLTGPLRSPSTSIDAVGAAEANAGTVAGVIAGGTTPLGILAGILGADQLSPGGGDTCAGPLALARGNAPAPAPGSAQPAARPAPPTQKAPNPAALLQQLLR